MKAAALGPALLAAGTEGDTPARAVIGAVLVAGFALLATSKPMHRLHRQRTVAALLSSGLLAVAIGMALGPFGLGFLDATTVLGLKPLLAGLVGWVGFIVGMQLRIDVLRRVPADLWRWATLDVVLAGGLAAALATAIALAWFAPEARSAAWLVAPAALLAAATIGWSPETRSVRVLLTPRTAELAVLVQACSGLLSAASIIVLGLLTQLVDLRGGAPILAPGRAALDALLAAAAATLIGAGGGMLVRGAAGRPGVVLAIFLSMVLLSAGIAVELGFSPLLTTMLAGAVLANMPLPPLRRFQEGLLRAEQPVGMACGLLAGAILDPRAGAWGLLLAAGLLAIRVVLKPTMARRFLAPSDADESGRSPLRFAPIRQAPLALVLALSVVDTTEWPLARLLVGVIAATALASEILALAIGSLRRRALRGVVA